MSTFEGTLDIVDDDESSLRKITKPPLTKDSLLLKGKPDAAQAMVEAAKFLKKTRKLLSGQRISVEGEAGETIGTVPSIRMKDARALDEPLGEAHLGIERNTSAESRELSDKTPGRKPKKFATKKSF